MKFVFKKIIVTLLTLEARATLWRYRPKIIAITGSVGKTSTKDAIYAVLSGEFHVRKSEKSFNSDLGVPLTILGLPNGWSNPFLWCVNLFRGFFSCFRLTSSFPKWLILEVGADHPGDIRNLTKWLKPDLVVVTKLSDVPVHVEFFNSPKDVAREKSFLVQAVKDSGTLFLNADDEDVLAMREIKRHVKLITFSIDLPSDFQASNIELAYEKNSHDKKISGMTFKVNHNGSCVPIKVSGALGKQHVYPVLAALAVGQSLGLNLVEMISGLEGRILPPGRMRVLSGIKGSLIIDDTYNSSPVAVSEALRALNDIKTPGKKIVVLGDMLDLGKYSVKAHEKAGKEAVGIADTLITVGLKARDIANGALNNGMDEKNIFQFDESAEAGKYIQDILSEADLVLVKGSQGIRMEKIVEEIMAEPQLKDDLLVRQDKEWRNR
ncbi:MAG: UDP-N-acetylmuramoyl-tripeptide--D-alanyl-D-alanine ligase [Patescibacteria group bacterium]